MTTYHAAVLIGSYVVGGIPFSYLIGRAALGVDLRTVGTGTATPTNLRRVGGVRLALVAGGVEVAKGMIGPAFVGTDYVLLAAGAGALTIAGHNWSPFLRGGGGRGISPATGALWIVAWPGALYLGGWLVFGVLAGRLAPVAVHKPDVPRPPDAVGTVPFGEPTSPAAVDVGVTTKVAARRSWRPKPDRVLAAMRLGLFTLPPFLAAVRGPQGVLVAGILLTPIGFKTVHEIGRRRLMPHWGRRA